MLEFVDTHCHIQSARANRGEESTRGLWEKAPDVSASDLVDQAVKRDVTRLICVGCTREDSELAVDFVETEPACWASIGLHPHEAKQYAHKKDELKKFYHLVARPKVVAIGECGLDYYYLHSPKDDQKTVLRKQLELALEHDLPLIFHVREAFEDFWPIFEAYPGIKGVLHSFTDTREQLDRALSHGLYIGVNGIVTFAKDEEQRAVYAAIPLDRLLLETDAPFLTPVPYRGKINTPERIVNIAEFLTKLRNESLEIIAKQTTDNARSLFAV